MKNLKNPELPPLYDVTAELAVLGAIILDNSLYTNVSLELGGNDFYMSTHQEIYRAIGEMDKEGTPIDFVTLTAKLKSENLLDSVGGEFFITQILDAVVTTANIKYYVGIVKDYATLRNIIKVCNALVVKGYNQDVEATGLIEEAAKHFKELQDKIVVKKTESIITVFDHTIQQLADSIGKTKPDIPTGIKSIDHLIWGLHRRELTVMAGRPGHFKTTFACWFVLQMLMNKMKGCIISLEMPKEQIFTHILVQMVAPLVSHGHIRRGQHTAHDVATLAESRRVVAGFDLDIYDSTNKPCGKTPTEIRKILQGKNYDFVMLDYISKMRVEAQAQETKPSVFTRYMNEMQDFAKEFDCVFLALAQMNREVELRKSNRPTLSDLKESGGIEEAADTILFNTYRYLYSKKQEDFHKLEIDCLKNRYDTVGWTEIYVDPPTFFFADLEKNKMLTQEGQ